MGDNVINTISDYLDTGWKNIFKKLLYILDEKEYVSWLFQSVPDTVFELVTEYNGFLTEV